MDHARISALLHPFIERTLSEVQLQQISTYIDLLRRWNARINLTAIRDSDEIVIRHFGESFFLARHLFPHEPAPAPSPAVPTHSATEMMTPGARSLEAKVQPGSLAGEDARPTPNAIQVLDIGSGAGFPGLPLKIWAPHIALTLVESNHKKATFLREVVRALTLTNVNVITVRAETLASPADLVTLRAVERFSVILPVAASLAKPSGRLALLIGAAQLPALSNLPPHFHAEPPIPVPRSESRVLSILVR